MNESITLNVLACVVCVEFEAMKLLKCQNIAVSLWTFLSIRIKQGWTTLSTVKCFANLFHLRSSKASEHRCGRGELGAEKTRDSKAAGMRGRPEIESWRHGAPVDWDLHGLARFNMVQESESAAVDWNLLAGHTNPPRHHRCWCFDQAAHSPEESLGKHGRRHSES